MGILAFVVSQGAGVRADPGFNPDADVSLSDYSTGANADVTSEFGVPKGDVNFDALITFTPGDPDDPSKGFFVAPGGDIPDGTEVGEHRSVATLGLLNGPCNNMLAVDFTLLDASLDTADTITFEEQFELVGGIPRGALQYPDFLNTLYPGITPWARMFSATNVAGVAVSLNFVVFAPGDMAGFSANWGYPSVTALNDPTAYLEPNPITDFCTPLETANTVYGLADGLAYRANPCAPGTYTFRSYSRGLPDADGDGFENDFDTCPYDANMGDARLPNTAGGGDGAAECDGAEELFGDGIDCACDPDPTLPSILDRTHCWPGSPGTTMDCDGDEYMNRQDNCPLVANPGQEDDDGDRIGNVCDTDGVAPKPEVTIELEVDISGPNVCPPEVVQIDIKPRRDPNSINLRSKGPIPVAVLTTEDFDATTVDPDTVQFGPSGASVDMTGSGKLRAAIKDVDHDGDLDLILRFRTQDTGIAPGDTEACLTGQTYDGVPIEGCDSVRTVP